ncbi:YaaR family protein [Listeria ivanovii]|uniref:UDP-N-acetylenolpyruvoylglucosamine reductase n=1 Tax=Listeria ivanovii (strain ATCC BAA-678 / PAM 55) TaxID=881621 RepID=G2ZCW6_LISIP|nr:YaaR family protein [Listeria ivanovii]AHI55222.1 UDP-N-acetylenolpyruvoylglucosamine reductase [Listeria ivanovii WSLC3009]AIS64676.1 UDP-N-acetylenolpyruvoylglucosamine reductase [Listeria ivanovii subsp. ivanovii]MBC1758628.1 YaaR family protein [Listeria ivanovii]MBK3913502.1 YaaR family protein [Listeria ivanovii subsp. ivanovii]MBK3920380.1 YaaR family protein [Listeria ivanovii subsp. ivanovii]
MNNVSISQISQSKQPSLVRGMQELNHTQQFYFEQMKANGKKVSPSLTEIKQLITQVTDKKTLVEMDMTVDNVLSYKKAVQSFLNFYVNNVMDYDNVESRHPKYGFSQKMTILKQVEQQTSELDDVMNLIDTKTGHLDMLNRIGEITGMILDVVL